MKGLQPEALEPTASPPYDEPFDASATEGAGPSEVILEPAPVTDVPQLPTNLLLQAHHAPKAYGTVDRVVATTFLVAGAAVGVFLLVAALVAQNPAVAARSVGPFLISGIAWRLRSQRRSPLPLLGISGAVIVITAVLTNAPMSYENGAHGVMGLALAGTLLTNERRFVLAASSGAILLLAVLRQRGLGEPPAEAAIAAAVEIAVVLVGGQLMYWARNEIVGREKRFENLFDHVPVAIWQEDFSGVAAWLRALRFSGLTDLRAYLEDRPDRVRYGASLIRVDDVNDAAMHLLQTDDKASLLGPLNVDHILEETLDALIEEMVAVWEGRAQFTIDVTGQTARGAPMEGYMLLAAPETSSGIDWSKVVVAMVDVSEQRAARRRLQQIIDSKDEFVASVSHELRTPLTTVIGLAQELRTNEDVIDAAERDELLGLIADQAMDVGNIVDDLLVAARADIGTIAIDVQPTNVEREIRQLLDGMQLLEIPVLRVDPEATAHADGHRFRQIMRNLISNAYRYGGGAVEIVARDDGGTVVVEVRDNGDGIPDDLRDKVFEPYERAHVAVGVTGSVGLGLTISRQLARLMGGDLAYARDGAITVFRLSLLAG